MRHVEITVDRRTGTLLLQDTHDLPETLRLSFAQLLGEPREIACAAPASVLPAPSTLPASAVGVPSVRLAGYWHNSLIEGPGRRSVAKFQGCPLRCPGFIYSMDRPGCTPGLSPTEAPGPVMARVPACFLCPAA